MDRLKASELMGRSQADFVERHEHNIKISDDELEQKLAKLLDKA